MAISTDRKPPYFCWLDLATPDARKAEGFYTAMFGWQAQHMQANGGEYVRFLHDGEAFATLYQLQARQIAAGVPSHWTPYVCVSDVHEMGSRAKTLGGEVVVNPFDVDGVARVSLIADSAGGLTGLWENWK